MMATKTAAKKTAPAKTARPRPTAEERRLQREAAALAAAAATAAKEAAFESVRSVQWLELFAKALRVEVLKGFYYPVTETQSWWFEDFRVDARKQSLRTNDTSASDVTLESLKESQVERIHQGLNMALEWFDEHDAEQARLRREAEELAARKQRAKDKLSDEDLAALGLRR